MNLDGHLSKLFYFVLIATFYAIIYYFHRSEFNGLDEESSFLDCWYFSFTTFSTVGYGDISPKTDKAKIFVLSQQMILLLDLSDNIFKFLGINLI